MHTYTFMFVFWTLYLVLASMIELRSSAPQRNCLNYFNYIIIKVLSGTSIEISLISDNKVRNGQDMSIRGNARVHNHRHRRRRRRRRRMEYRFL